MKTIISSLFVFFLLTSLLGQTNPTPQALPYTQNFSTLTFNSTTYPAGLLGWNQGLPSSNFVTSTPTANRSMTAPSNASSTTANLHNYNGKIGFLNSNNANLALATSVITTGKQNIQVAYTIMVIRNPYDGSVNTRICESTVQYRIGETGFFTTISGVEYQNGTVSQTGTSITGLNPLTKLANLPSVCNDQSVVQLRWIAKDVSGIGDRPSFAIDDISITGDPITLPVEFSGMSVTPGTDNNAYITWTTQSETGVNGFYVLRGCSDLLSEAAIISPLIQAANTSSTQTYFFADDDLPSAGLYYYWLQSLDYNGETSYFGPQTLVWSPGDPAGSSVPLETGLSTLYPNPFNPSLTIAYALYEAAPAQIMIYNLRGHAVHSIDMGGQVAGEHKFVWNGTSDRGEACPSGVYRIVLHAGKVIDSRKVLLLK